MNLLEEHGLIIGALLLLLVAVCAVQLGRRAARRVEEFREEHHQSFLGSRKK